MLFLGYMKMVGWNTVISKTDRFSSLADASNEPKHVSYASVTAIITPEINALPDVLKLFCL